jgi:hypothetical protein
VLTSSNQIPKFDTSRQTNVVCHREYLGDILGTSAFNNTMYPLNPGMSQTFPWLSTVAQNYQEYRFHGLIFEFRPLITDFVTSGAPGVVIMATNYNADSAAYNTKQAMENSEFAVATKPTTGLIHGVECAVPLTTLPQRYVRSSAPGVNQDLRFTDYGNFQFATQNNPVQNLGELWVSYCVEFFKPQLPIDVGGLASSGHMSRSADADPTHPLGVSTLYNSGSLALTVAGSQVLSWFANPGQQYFVHVAWLGGTASTTPAGTTVQGLGVRSYMKGDTASAVVAPLPAASSSQAAFTRIYYCTLTSPGLVNVIFDTAGSFPSSSYCDIYVMELSNTVVN